jgi:regulator of protease activity HflC (stomatin/prohibitin superfamily)
MAKNRLNQCIRELTSSEATSWAEAERMAAAARGDATRLATRADADAQRIRADAEVDALNRLAQSAAAYAEHAALLRVRELETLGALGANASARLYIGFDKHTQLPDQRTRTGAAGARFCRTPVLGWA